MQATLEKCKVAAKAADQALRAARAEQEGSADEAAALAGRVKDAEAVCEGEWHQINTNSQVDLTLESVISSSVCESNGMSMLGLWVGSKASDLAQS